MGDISDIAEAAKSTASGLNILNPEFLPSAATINKVTAFDFFMNSGKDAEEAILHMRGIDFSQPVSVTTLDAGTILEQYIKWGRKAGNYFSMPGANPLELGIGDAVTRDATLFRSTEPVTALQTTASNFLYPDQVVVPWTGGGIQFYIPNKGAFSPIK
ncbi:MAG: polymorphic toxin type 46 domain-containing protein [Phycisphaerae bacterium]